MLLCDRDQIEETSPFVWESRATNEIESTCGRLAVPRGASIKIGLALGSGGARGAAHLGVLQLLEEEGIGVDVISGTSAGAMVAVLYACGLSPAEILQTLEQEIAGRHRLRFLDFRGWRRMRSLFRSGRVRDMLRRHTAGRMLEDLDLPVYVTATDLNRGEQVVFSEGDPVEAVLASMCLPLLLDPITQGDSLLVDGAVTGSLPASLLREHGADFVIGVDVSPHYPTVRRRNSLKSPLWLLTQLVHVQQHRLGYWDRRAVDLLIRPDTTGFGMTEVDRAADLMRLGRIAAFEALPELTEALDDRKCRNS